MMENFNKETQAKTSDGYIAMWFAMLVITAVLCFGVIVGLMIFVDMMFHWWLIFAPMILIIMILPATLTAMIAKIFGFKNNSFHGLMVGVVYGVLSNGALMLVYHGGLDGRQMIGFGGVVLVWCVVVVVVGLISVRFLPKSTGAKRYT